MQTRYHLNALIVLVLLGAATATDGQVQPQIAQRWFEEATKLCERDAGRLWGVSLCGPMVIFDQPTRTPATSQPEPEGPVPRLSGFADGPVSWGGVRWFSFPLYMLADTDADVRQQNMLHGLFHRIQPELGLITEDGFNEHLDTLEGRYWIQLEWRALHRFGTYNLTGHSMTFRDFLEACRSAVRSSADFVWLPLEFLHAHGVDPAPGSLGYFPFWHPEPDRRGLFQISSQKAFAAGWRTRPFRVTALDYLEWYRESAPDWKDELSPEIETRVVQAWTSSGHDGLSVRNADGLQLLVAPENAQPTLRVLRPDHEKTDRSIDILFPEHVTAVKHGESADEQLYMFRPGLQGERPRWRRVGRSLEYERDLPGDVHLLARATLEDDGVRFHYEVTNDSSVSYDMIIAVTDPRLTSDLHDPRLERTYVHHQDGFDLIASETPSRLTAPLDQWLPSRYLVSFTWPVPAQRAERRSDGITYYNKSRPVDEPFIATLSADSKWLVASFAREVGNVWTNPALTCQHVDPQTPLAPRKRTILERKMLIFRGSLDDALQRARRQRKSLRY